MLQKTRTRIMPLQLDNATEDSYKDYAIARFLRFETEQLVDSMPRFLRFETEQLVDSSNISHASYRSVLLCKLPQRHITCKLPQLTYWVDVGQAALTPLSGHYNIVAVHYTLSFNDRCDHSH